MGIVMDRDKKIFYDNLCLCSKEAIEKELDND